MEQLLLSAGEPTKDAVLALRRRDHEPGTKEGQAADTHKGLVLSLLT